jgi:predicted dehydrogenase
MKIGIVGIGGHGAGHLQAIVEGSGMELAGVCDQNETLVQNARQQHLVPGFTDWRRFIEETEMDGLIACLPHDLYDELLAAACEKKIHVLKEKPLARNLAEAKRFVQYADQAGVTLMVGTQRRFNPAFYTMNERKALMGHLFLARAHYIFCWQPDFAWRGQKARAGGGAMLDMGYHPVDQLTWQMGLPAEVYAMQSKEARPNTPFPYDTDDTGILVCRYDNGAIGYIFMSWVTSPFEESFYLHGSEGVMSARWNELTILKPNGVPIEELTWESSGYDALRLQVEYFASCVKTGQEPSTSARANLANMRLLEAAYLSAEQRQPIQMGSIG